LVLNAAVATRDIATQLAERGQHELAEAKATAGLGRDTLTGALLTASSGDGAIHDDLRGQALRALRSGTDSAAPPLKLLEPVPVDEIQAGLAEQGADALVYLMPSGSGPGVAVVVPVTCDVDTLSLPGLTVGPESPVRRYASTAHAAGTPPRSPPARTDPTWTAPAWTTCAGGRGPPVPGH
jgi:hypothetical protein